MIYFICGILVLIVIYALIIYNSLVKLNIKVKEAFSTMDVYLKKRWDLIPKIVETVKKYEIYESETLKAMVELRNKSYNSLSDNDKVINDNELSKNIDKMMVLAESYPELKASENFLDLSRQLTKVEDEIANSRKYYNGSVRMFNIKKEIFPNNIFAMFFGFKSKEMYQIKNEERENVKVNL